MENRIKYSVGIAVCVITAVFVFQFLWVSHLYRLEKNTFTERMESAVESAVVYLNTRQVYYGGLERKEVLAYDPKKNQLVILRDGKNFFYPVPVGEKIEKIFNRAMYDVRIESWSVKALDSIVRKEVGKNYEAIGLECVVKDSLENELEVTGDMDLSRSGLLSYTVPLGYFAGRRLDVYFNFPLINFWHKESDRIVLAIGLFLLLVIGIYFLVQTILIQKKVAAFREDFMRFIVHDLKSPVNFLRTTLFFIRQKSTSLYTEEQQQLYEQSEDRLKGLSASIQHLLTASVDIYGLKLDRCWLDLKSEIEKMIAYHSLDINKNIKMLLDYRLPDGMVWADRLHLMGAIANLVDNAVKYGGDSVKIQITCCYEKKRLVITVKDDGKGIPAGEIKQVFRKYYRLKRDKGNVKGFGLGLSYVGMVVRAYKGRVRLISGIGKGCEFIIRLPWNVR